MAPASTSNYVQNGTLVLYLILWGLSKGGTSRAENCIATVKAWEIVGIRIEECKRGVILLFLHIYKVSFPGLRLPLLYADVKG
jgi:hypothetical protein